MIILRRVIVSFLALTCLGLGVFAYNEHEARLTAEDLARTLRDKNAALQKARDTRWSARAPATTPAAEVTFPAGIAPEGEQPEGRTPENRPRMANNMRAAAAEFIGMMDTPEMQQLMNLRSRGVLDGRYASLFKNLNLPPDQLKKFQDLLLDKQSTMRDVLAAMRNQGLMPNRENADQMRALVQNANDEIDSQIRSTLGENAFAQYQEYEHTQPQRATVERVQQRLSYSTQPLTDQQASQLVSVMAQEAQARNSANGNNGGGGSGGFRRLGPGGGNGTAAITDQTIQQASTILSPAQLTTLQEVQQEQQAQAQLSRRARDAFTGARQGGTAGVPAGTPAGK